MFYIDTPIKCSLEIAFCPPMSFFISVFIPFLLLCPQPILLPPLFIVLQLQPLKLDNTMGDRGGGPCRGLLGEARGRGWIKGPPVLHGMINDLQISGGQPFLIGQH